MNDKFHPPEDVTIHDALRYLEAIESAVRRDIRRLPIEERSLMVGIIAGAMSQTSETLTQFRIDMEESGEATPVTEEQKMQLRMTFRSAFQKDKPES